MEAKLRSISKLWQDSFDLFIKHIGNLLLLALVPAVGMFILFGLLFGGLIGYSAISDPSTWDVANGLSGILGALSLVGIFAILTVLVQAVGALLLVVYTVNHKKPLSLKQTFSLTGKFFWRFIGLSLLIVFLNLLVLGLGSGLVALVVGVITNLANAGDGLFVPLFFSLLTLPILATIVFGVYLNFAQYYLVDKDSRAWESFKMSFRLVHGNFWPIALRLLLFIVPIIALSIVFSIIPLLGSLLTILIIPPLTIVYYYDIYRDLLDLLKKK